MRIPSLTLLRFLFNKNIDAILGCPEMVGGGIPAKDLVGTTSNCNSDAADDAAAYDD